MISSNTRATRSRYSSPAQPQNGSWNGPAEAPKSSKEASSRTFMQNWLEPSIQSKASFEEAGLVRYGVLESMAPLGAMPKSNKKPTNENGQPVRKIILRPSGVGVAHSGPEPTPKAAASAPSSPPPAEVPHPASAPPPRRSLANKAAATVTAEDDDYDPKVTTRRRQPVRASLPNKARRSSGARRASMSSTKPVATPTRRIPRAVEPHERDMVDRVVEEAVEEALKHYRYPTAWALRTLYDEKSGDSDFVAMVEDIFNQTAEPETMEEFSRLMEEKKREGKKDNQGCYYFVPPATNSRFTPHKPKAAPYAKLLQGSHNKHRLPEGQSDETRATKRAKVSHGGNPTTPRKARSNGLNGTGSKSVSKTPRSRKRARRDSGSSESSLSSAMSLSSPEGDGEGGSAEAESPSLSPSFRGGAAAAAAAVTGAKSQSQSQPAAPKSRPITTRGKSLASKHGVSNTSGSSNSPTILPGGTHTHAHTHTHNHAHSHTHSRAHSTSHSRSRSHIRVSSSGDASMPGRLAASDLFPSLSSKSTGKPPKDDAGSRMPDEDEADDDDGFWTRRREAQKVTNNYSAVESSIRPNHEERNTTPARTTRKTRQSLLAPASQRATRSASKRPSDDAESVASPVAFSFPGFPGEDSSTVGSRAATPTSMRASKKPKTGLRIKSSPVKKKGGTAAGVPRSVAEAQSSVNSGVPKDQVSDNDEHCSACGNTGDVVCCDGCPRSFHFECVDMIQSEHLPDEWYCNECLIKRYPSRVPVHRGSFASALNNLEKSIPRAFSLPKKLQNRFEGVRAGADGDYEEVLGRQLGKKKGGYDELPDFFKQREDGQAVLCHNCQKPATEIRAIIPCSVCPFHWHIDCLDPPLAVPPVLKTWRCPAHVDDVLTETPRLAPAHRYRKIKGSQVITPALSRGVKNNGHIDVDWTDQPEDDSNDAGWPEPESFGRVYKLPAKGIVLDFIEQLRRQGAGYGPRRGESRRVPYLSPPVEDLNRPLHGSALDRSVEEMQLSLNLVSLKQRRSEGVDQLVSALLAGADSSIVSLMAQGNADNIASGTLTENDRVGLRSILAQMDTMSARIREVLGEDAPIPVQGTTPISQAAGEEEVPEKMEPLVPITEPTPPSTIGQAEGGMDLD